MLHLPKSLTEKLALKSGERDSNVMNYKLNFLFVRSSLLCLRGSRTIRKYLVESGADFGPHNFKLNLEG